jgi:hypothetical protein
MQPTAHSVKATTPDGSQVEFDPSQLKFSLGQPVDEETFKARYQGQGVAAPRVINMHDLARLKLQHKLQAMRNSRTSQPQPRDPNTTTQPQG